MIDLKELSADCFANAWEKGFWEVQSGEKFPFYAYKLQMITSEVTEIMEAIRKEKGEEEVAKEFADVIIRLVDLWQGLVAFGEISDLSLEQILMDKVEYNKTRPVKHGVRG